MFRKILALPILFMQILKEILPGGKLILPDNRLRLRYLVCNTITITAPISGMTCIACFFREDITVLLVSPVMSLVTKDRCVRLALQFIIVEVCLPHIEEEVLAEQVLFMA